MVYCSLARGNTSIHPTRKDVATDFKSNPVLRWMIMSCFRKPKCTYGIIVSLWLIYYIQCGFSISYLSIPGVLAHDRSNISQIFIFFFLFTFNVRCRTVPFIYITVFQVDSKQGSVVGRWVGKKFES